MNFFIEIESFMPRNNLPDSLREKIKVLDGAMGTLQQPQLKPGTCVELANLEQPDLVQRAYSEYFKAAAGLLRKLINRE